MAELRGFQIEKPEFTYDDITVSPNFTDFPFEKIDLRTRVSRNVVINVPLVAAPMDTVTNSTLAIALAQAGGLAFIHYNFPDDNRIEQVKEIIATKRFEAGLLIDKPVTLSPENKVDDADKIELERKISTIPITEDGSPHGKFVTILFPDDYSISKHSGMKIRDRMRRTDDLPVLVWDRLPKNEKEREEHIKAVILDSHYRAAAITDKTGNLMYLSHKNDAEKRDYPDACRDSKGRLKVGAAIKTRDGIDTIRKLVNAGANPLVIDTSHGDRDYIVGKIATKSEEKKIEGMVRMLKREFGDAVDIIAGNFVTPEACERAISAGVDGLRIGVGSGSICTTQTGTGVGRPQGSAVYCCSRIAREHNIPLIADGGIRGTADILKALVLGASCVMVGNLLAGTDEAPGEYKLRGGIRTKDYEGMGSREAMLRGGADRYGIGREPEGVAAEVVGKGPLIPYMARLMNRLKQGMERVGRTVGDLYSNGIIVYSSPAAQIEGRPHDVIQD